MSRVKSLNGINFENFYSSGGTIISTTNVLTKGHSILIPANTFKNNDVIRVVSSSYNATSSDAWYTNFYTNTGNTITGALQISTCLGALNSQYMQHSRTFKILDSTGAGLGTLGISTDRGSGNEFQTFSVSTFPILEAIGYYAIDWTKDQYVMVGFYGETTAQSITNVMMKIYTY